MGGGEASCLQPAFMQASATPAFLPSWAVQPILFSPLERRDTYMITAATM